MTYNIESFRTLSISRPPAEKHKVSLSVNGDSFSFSYKAREILHSNKVKVLYDGKGTYAFVGCTDGQFGMRFHSKELRRHMNEESGFTLSTGAFKWFPVEINKQFATLFFSVLTTQE